ncbi:MAG: UDP-N-acetylmuramoyl-L-alanyl-D-glutamate--2,6-diaminopimelate ligase [Actinomycetota bacterium]
MLLLPPVPLPSVVDAVPGAERRGDAVVGDVVFDSREVTPGALFCCVPGVLEDGHAYAPAAVAAGAAALLVERWLDDVAAPQVRVPSVREAMGPVAAVVFAHPADTLTIAGITGTNGKTTVTYLIESIWRAAGVRPGVIGTTGARVDGEPIPLARTTPEAPDLHRLLARMRDAGVTGVALEVSSHALAQHRVGGVRFDVAAFLNLSRDHLDFHPSMEDYFEAKASLFTPAYAARAVVNADDPWARRLLATPTVPTTTYGVERDADVRATGVTSTVEGVSFTVDGVGFRSPLRGGFNVSNCLAAIAVAKQLGIGSDVAAEGIAAVAGVPGRVEPVDAGQDFLVVVDYAHTPDSIRSVLQAARPLASGRLIVVFGCGGDRDRAKRPLMGAAASAAADLTVITSDNPRSEDPLAIIVDVEVGARDGGGDYVVEPDRRAAIGLAIDGARAGDVVVIAGKGHEPYQELAGGTVPFDDREVAREALERRGARP